MENFMGNWLALWLFLTVPVIAQVPPTDSTVVADTTRRTTDSLTVDEADEFVADEEADSPADTIMVAAPNDRSPQTARLPTDSTLHRYRADPDYQYTDDVPPPDSLIGKFFSWFFRWLRDFLSGPAYQSFWRYVIIAGIAALVIYLGIKAEYLGFLVPSRSSRLTLDYENLKEDIHAINFEQELETAAEQGNYRLGVRLLYLRTLKQLTDRQLIDWKPDKTNQQYAYELANQPFATEFNALTRDFDYVWYGDFPVDKPQFVTLQANFGAFAQQLPTTVPLNL
jgi:hypothetical protein